MKYSDIVSIRYFRRTSWVGLSKIKIYFDETKYNKKSKNNKSGRVEASDLEELRSQLEECNILNWDRHYECEFDIPDGTRWELEIKSNEIEIKKSGHNAFPIEHKKFEQLLKNF